MFNNYIKIFIFLIFLIIILLVIYWYVKKNRDKSTTPYTKMENLQNFEEKNNLYQKLKKNIDEILVKKYTFSEIKDNPKLRSNLESISKCIVNKILKHVDLEKAYFMSTDNFDKLYELVYKKDPTIYSCFNEKQLKAIKILGDRISNTNLDSIIEYVKKNIKIGFSECKNNDCFSENELFIINNYNN